MSATTVERFCDSLERVGAGWTTAAPADVEAVLDDLVRDPAVGVPLDVDGTDLPADVDTDPSPVDLEAAATGVTRARGAIADYGSLVLESTPAGEEAASLFVEHHVAVVRESDVRETMADALDALGPVLRDGGSAVLATGPSATADMGDLVQGAHGPETVDVVVVEGR